MAVLAAQFTGTGSQNNEIPYQSIPLLQYRLVVKTSLKLLLVFVEYSNSNSMALLSAITTIDRGARTPTCTHLITLLTDTQCGDNEMLTLALSLINKMLHAFPDQVNIEGYPCHVDT
jgi:hypothetical protein